MPDPTRSTTFIEFRELYAKALVTNECVLMRTGLDSKGYPRIRVNGVRIRASRYSFELYNGRPITSENFACHHCDNPGCINPKHIFEGTPAENSFDMVQKKRAAVPKNKKRTPELDLAIKEMWAVKKNKTHIAKAFGVSDYLVSNVLKA